MYLYKILRKFASALSLGISPGVSFWLLSFFYI